MNLKKKNRKVCVVSSSRADYNHLYPLMIALKSEKMIDFKLVVTGMHLLKEYGYTFREVINDGFKIDGKIKTNQKSSSSRDIIGSMSYQMKNAYTVLNKIKPDILVILGDRYDILPIVITSQILQIPVAHFHGGEKTIAVMDDNIRHSITKLSHLHFVANNDFYNRVKQLGENKKYIHNIGSLGVLALKNLKLYSREKIFKLLKINNAKKYIVISLHPEIIMNETKNIISNTLLALDKLEGYYIIFTKSNSDKYSNIINDSIDKYILKNKEKSLLIDSAGRELYLSLVKNSETLVGNSSSCLIEAPFLKVPSVLIGKRQSGRPISQSTIQSSTNVNTIYKSINKAVKMKVESSSIIHYKPSTALNKIVNILKRCDLKKILVKDFCDIKI